MKMITILLFLQAIPVFADLSLNSELMKFEEKKKNNQINATDVVRLSELYFLSSRCSEVKALFIYEKKLEALSLDEKQIFYSMICACGGTCNNELEKTEQGRFLKQLSLFSAQLQGIQNGSKKWSDKSVQKQWGLLKNFPEAAYLAQKSLKNAPLKSRISYSPLINQLESELDAYEVRN